MCHVYAFYPAQKSKSTLKIMQKSTLKSRNPIWNPISTWNPVDFEISYAETRRGGPLGKPKYGNGSTETKLSTATIEVNHRSKLIFSYSQDVAYIGLRCWEYRVSAGMLTLQCRLMFYPWPFTDWSCTKQKLHELLIQTSCPKASFDTVPSWCMQ